MQVQTKKVTSIAYSIEITEEECKNLLGDIRFIHDIVSNINGGMMIATPHLFDLFEQLGAFD